MILYTQHFVLILSVIEYSVDAACPINCNSCDVYDSCTSCNPEHWGFNTDCHFTCNKNCLNKECDDETGYCISCKPGLYGIQCQHHCSLCKDGLCDLEFCTNGCKAGFYEYNTGTESFCWPCPLDCSLCASSSICNVCNDGYQLYKFNLNGNIVAHCRLCTQSDICSNTCEIQNCKSCIVVEDVLSCTECIDGHALSGEICLVNVGICSEGCSTECDENGICTGSCSAGWTGDKCSNTCAEKCFSCDKSNVNICKECKGDYYTATCDLPCKQSCMKMTGNVTCRLNDGYCNNGCENKTWGPICNTSCSVGCANNGILPVCDRANGYCLHGCMDGYTGEKCDVMLPVLSTTQSEVQTTMTQLPTQSETSTCKDNESIGSFVTAYVSGFGTAMAIVAVLIVLYYTRRRHALQKLTSQHRDRKETQGQSTYYNVTTENATMHTSVRSDKDNYEHLQDNRNSDIVYTEIGNHV